MRYTKYAASIKTLIATVSVTAALWMIRNGNLSISAKDAKNLLVISKSITACVPQTTSAHEYAKISTAV